MFYKIDKDYYILVGNKYIQVDFEVNGNDINSKPLNKEIERTPKINAKPQPYNDDFIKEIIESKKPKEKKNEFKESPRFGK